MKAYVKNIEKLALQNEYFRQVLYTNNHLQIVVMSLIPGEDIGEEVHEDVDQFIRIEQGSGTAIIDGESYKIEDGSVVVVPMGAKHNIINATTGPMKLYTIYVPPHHKDGTIHKTKSEAEHDEEHFDGNITTQGS
jgi:mannose-6-phosphate isomerase-like protein (cupin superfamily)